MPVQRTTTDTDHSYDDRSREQSPRHESVIDRLDRNWTEILQEIRVAQTGVHLLTAFLLTLPFQQRFARLDDLQLRAYLATVALSAGATIRLIAPVMVHRILFSSHPRLVLVAAPHRCAIAGLLLRGLALVGVIYVTLSVVGSPAEG